jgi:hypothetical protein
LVCRGIADMVSRGSAQVDAMFIDLKLTEIEETNWQKPLGILLQNLLY